MPARNYILLFIKLKREGNGMTEELLAKMIVILFVVALLIIDFGKEVN